MKTIRRAPDTYTWVCASSWGFPYALVDLESRTCSGVLGRDGGAAGDPARRAGVVTASVRARNGRALLCLPYACLWSRADGIRPQLQTARLFVEEPLHQRQCCP